MSEKPKKPHTNAQVILFMMILSFVCALILSVLASALEGPKEVARELDRSRQMMIAAKMLSHDGYFLIKAGDGDYVPAKYQSSGFLVQGTHDDIASKAEIIEIYQKRLIPYLVDDAGNLTTFETARINIDEYIKKYRKTGYYKEPFKLLYKILPNSENQDQIPVGYVIPVNGYGLWDAIYGYIAIEPDGDTVIGISWYDQKETPGLGADITTSNWQDLFPGKLIFQEMPNGKTDFKTAVIGIEVVKGKVVNVLGDSNKAKSAVDGMAGATLTGNGVTESYKNVLNTYRPFFIKIHDANVAINANAKSGK